MLIVSYIYITLQCLVTSDDSIVDNTCLGLNMHLLVIFRWLILSISLRTIVTYVHGASAPQICCSLCQYVSRAFYWTRPRRYLTCAQSRHSVSSSNCVVCGAADLLAQPPSLPLNNAAAASAPAVRRLWIYPHAKAWLWLATYINVRAPPPSVLIGCKYQQSDEQAGPLERVVRWQAGAWWLKRASCQQKVTGLICSPGKRSWLGVLEQHTDPRGEANRFSARWHRLYDRGLGNRALWGVTFYKGNQIWFHMWHMWLKLSSRCDYCHALRGKKHIEQIGRIGRKCVMCETWHEYLAFCYVSDIALSHIINRKHPVCWRDATLIRDLQDKQQRSKNRWEKT